MKSRDVKRPGRSLEAAVARIQQMMDPKCRITRNERIVDRLGNRREFDVVMRGTVGGREILGVIECRDHARRVGTPQVEAFVTKARNVNANVVLMVARNGFSEPAIAMARHEGIGTLSLLPDDESTDFTIGATWFAKSWYWDKLALTVHFAMSPAPITGFQAESITYRGRRVIDWFHKELVTTYRDWTEPELAIEVAFSRKRTLTIEGGRYKTIGLSLVADRRCRQKYKWVQVSGDAFYDWASGKVSIPAGGQVVTGGVRTDLADWHDYDGDIDSQLASPKELLVCCFVFNKVHFDPSAKVIDLSKL